MDRTEYMDWLDSDERWVSVIHPKIKMNQYEISSHGRIRDIRGVYYPEYHSTNGYDYTLMSLQDEDGMRLFPVDILIATGFLLSISNIDASKPIKVIHINGDLRNNHATNLQIVEDIEEWRPLLFNNHIKHRYEYEVSNWGHIRRKHDKHNMMLKDLKGYKIIWMCDHKIRVNRAVAESFVSGKTNERKYVNHINGLSGDNHYLNLEWVTHRENMMHAIDTGLKRTKVTVVEMDMILDMLYDEKYGHSPKVVFNNIDHIKHPNITIDTVSDIKRNRYKRSKKYNITHIKFPDIDHHVASRSHVTIDIADMIRDMLIKYDFSIVGVFNHIDHHEYPFITHTVIKKIKNGSHHQKSDKYNLKEFNALARSKMRTRRYL